MLPQLHDHDHARAVLTCSLGFEALHTRRMYMGMVCRSEYEQSNLLLRLEHRHR